MFSKCKPWRTRLWLLCARDSDSHQISSEIRNYVNRALIPFSNSLYTMVCGLTALYSNILTKYLAQATSAWTPTICLRQIIGSSRTANLWPKATTKRESSEREGAAHRIEEECEGSWEGSGFWWSPSWCVNIAENYACICALTLLQSQQHTSTMNILGQVFKIPKLLLQLLETQVQNLCSSRRWISFASSSFSYFSSSQELRLVFPNSHRVNRGNYVVKELAEACRANDVTDLIVVHEHRGTPDALIVSHFPHGPTVYFTLNNVALRHDISTYKNSTVSEQYPHLIFENFSSQLGERIRDVLKYLFPVPKEDSKRVMTFANEDDFVSFRWISDLLFG